MKSKTTRQKRLQHHLFYAVVIMLVSIIAGYRGILPVFRSYLKDYLAIGDASFGLLFSIGAFVGLPGVLLGGYLVDRWGPQQVIRICLTGVGAAMLLIALGGQCFWIFIVAMGIGGLFNAPLFIAISAYLGKLFPRNQRQVLSLNLASYSIGGMMFPLVAEGLLFLVKQFENIEFRHILHSPFLLTGSLLIGLSFIYRKNPLSSPSGHFGGKTSRGLHLRDFWLSPNSRLLAFLFALHGTADSAMYLWMARFLESNAFFPRPFPPGLVLTGYSLAYLLSRVFLASLPDRAGRRAFLVFPGLLGGSIVIAGIISHNYLLTAGGYVLGAFCWSGEAPTFVSMLMRIDRRHFGAAMATAGLIGGVLLFTVMNTMGFLIERLGEVNMWKVMLLPACGFLLVGLGGTVWLLKYDRQILKGRPSRRISLFTV